MRPSALALGKGDSASQSLPRVCRWNAHAKHVKDCMWTLSLVEESLALQMRSASEGAFADYKKLILIAPLTLLQNRD